MPRTNQRTRQHVCLSRFVLNSRLVLKSFFLQGTGFGRAGNPLKSFRGKETLQSSDQARGSAYRGSFMCRQRSHAAVHTAQYSVAAHLRCVSNVFGLTHGAERRRTLRLLRRSTAMQQLSRKRGLRHGSLLATSAADI